MMIDLTLTHPRVAAACTWGATEATILRELLGPNPALCERLPVIRAIKDLEALGTLHRSADGHFWLMGRDEEASAPQPERADHTADAGKMVAADHFVDATEMVPVPASAVHSGPMPEAKPLGGHIGPAPDPVPLRTAAVAADPTIRAEPIRTTDAAIRYLEAHGHSVVPMARGLYLIDGMSSLGKADLIDRAEILRARTMKRHQQRKAKAA